MYVDAFTRKTLRLSWSKEETHFGKLPNDNGRSVSGLERET